MLQGMSALFDCNIIQVLIYVIIDVIIYIFILIMFSIIRHYRIKYVIF